MQYSSQVIVKRWIPILEEYERTKAKVNPRPFKFVKNLCDAHHIIRKWDGSILLNTCNRRLTWRKRLSSKPFGLLLHQEPLCEISINNK